MREFTDENFYDEVEHTDNQVVMVLFWAAWCGVCRSLKPNVEQLAVEFIGKAVIGSLNVDDNPDIPQKYGIRSVPTILFFNNGEVTNRETGNLPTPVLSQILEAGFDS